MEGAGPLSDKFHVGFHNHAMLAVTPDRVPLGVLGSKVWARDWDEFWENQRNKSLGREGRSRRLSRRRRVFVGWKVIGRVAR